MHRFTKELRLKGWKIKDMADRWGITPGQMTNIARSPKQRDWDALKGLPVQRGGVDHERLEAALEAITEYILGGKR